MSDWVKFHRELRQGAKRGLSRATRFVYLELAQESRKTRGMLTLPPGMEPVDAVHDLLGGSRAEVETALADLASPAFDMITIESGRIVLPSWEAWNSIDENAAKRARKYRKNKASRRQHATVTPSDTEPSRVTPANVMALEESREEERREDPPKAPQAVTGVVAIGTAGAMALVESYEDAVRHETRQAFGLDRFAQQDIAAIIETHCPKDAESARNWLYETTKAFVVATRANPAAHSGFKPRRMLDWLNGGRPVLGPKGPKDVQQRKPGEERAWKIGDGT